MAAAVGLRLDYSALGLRALARRSGDAAQHGDLGLPAPPLAKYHSARGGVRLSLCPQVTVSTGEASAAAKLFSTASTPWLSASRISRNLMRAISR